MTKFRKSILICGCIVLCVIGALVAFLTLSASGMIVTDPIEITVRAEDNQKEYDGTPLTAVRYTVADGELLRGHALEVTYLGSQTAVGSSEGTLVVKVIDGKKRDVSQNYIFTIEPCRLEVTQRSLSLVQKNVTREYDGAGVEGGEYVVQSGTLCDGHRVVRSGEGVVAEVGRDVEDTAVPHVYDALGTDVTANYAIDFTPGIISVQRRALTVTPLGADKVYDGLPLVPAGYAVTEGSLLAGHRMEVSYETVDGNAATITDASSVAVRIADVAICDAQGNDVSNNYSVTHTATATLTVDKCPLKVVGKSSEFVYNGKEQHAEETDNAPESYSGYLAGADLSVTYTAKRKDAGEAPNDFTVQVHRNGEDVSDNYTVEKTVGTLTVLPVPATATFTAYQTDYTGNELQLLPSLLVRVGGSLSETLQEELLGKLQTDRAVKNAGEYTLRFVDAHNFDLSLQDENGNAVEYGALTVKPAAVDISYRKNEETTVRKVYDGTPLRLGTDYFACADLSVAESETKGSVTEGVYVFSAVAASDSADQGNYTIDVQKIVLYNAAGENVTSNYAIGTVQVEGTIQKRKITVEAGDIYWILAEGNLKEKLGLSVGSRLADGEEVDFSNVTLRVNGNLLEFDRKQIRIYGLYDGKDTTENYEIEWKTGTYTFVGEE